MTSIQSRCLALLVALAPMGCAAPAAGPADVTVTPVYAKDTGRLEQIVSDRNGDGAVDARAYMDGARLERIEIDRNGDRRADRWEYYGTPGRPGAPVQIERAEEANGPDDRVTRREFYQGGVVLRVEEDTDGDGRVDKWEHFEGGQLASIDLDLQGAGFPDRRMHYRRDGSVSSVEVATERGGAWKPFTPPTR